MTLPIAIRELTVASKRPLSWRIRLAMTALAILVCVAAMTLGGTPASSLGRNAFEVMTGLALAYALLAGLFFTADCISEERREGTFGLLYLTRLSSWDVIFGKLMGTSLQAVFGLIAIFPVLFVPVLAGGVTGAELARMIAVLLVTILMSLAAGLFASACTVRSRSALGLATLLILLPVATGCFGWVLCTLAFSVFLFKEKNRNWKSRAAGAAACLVSVVILVAMLARARHGLAGSPLYSFYTASDLAWTARFLPSLVVQAGILVFYLFAANLCTEWHRGPRDLAAASTDLEERSKSAFTPGRRSKRPVGDQPLAWLLREFQPSRTMLFISVGLMLLLNLFGGRGPFTGFVFPVLFMVFFSVPYLLFNFSLSHQCATPLATLRRTGFLEAILTTPIRLADVLMAQKELYWRTLKMPVALLLLISFAGPYRMTRFMSGEMWFPFAITAIFGWIIFFVRLHALFWVTMAWASSGLKPAVAVLRSLLAVVVVPALFPYLFVMFGSLFRSTLGNGQFVGLFQYFVGQGIVLGFYLFLIRWAKVKLRLRPPVEFWPIIPARFHPRQEAD